MKVISYMKSVPSANSNKQKTDLLIKYIQGVNTVGDDGSVYYGDKLVDCDVAVIQGWVHQNIDTPHLKLRKNIIDYQNNKKLHTLIADSNLFLYADLTNKHGYLRYSFDGVFPNTGIYFDDNPTPSRWEMIKKDTGITLEKNKKDGKHILLCMQRNGGWSMGNLNIEDWALKTIKKIRKNSDRPILIRAHPNDKKSVFYLKSLQNNLKNYKNVDISDLGKKLEQDLHRAHAVVNHNSSSIVGPIIKGYHAFVTDPEKSNCKQVSHCDFSYIENPQIFDREAWLHRISMFHWKFSELENGSAWKHMRNYVFQ